VDAVDAVDAVDVVDEVDEVDEVDTSLSMSRTSSETRRCRYCRQEQFGYCQSRTHALVREHNVLRRPPKNAVRDFKLTISDVIPARWMKLSDSIGSIAIDLGDGGKYGKKKFKKNWLIRGE
jgi:hypothetical protein